MNILLFGICNVGKSTVGSILADKLGYSYYDLDDEVKAHCNMTIEQFINTVWPYERDKIRGEVIGRILRNPGDKVIAVTPMYYTRCFSKYLQRPDVTAIELQDSPENIFDRLVFSDEKDRVYKDDEYRDAHSDYYLREIRKDITFYKKPFSRVTNKYMMNNEAPDVVADHLISRFGLRLSADES